MVSLRSFYFGKQSIWVSGLFPALSISVVTPSAVNPLSTTLGFENDLYMLISRSNYCPNALTGIDLDHSVVRAFSLNRCRGKGR